MTIGNKYQNLIYSHESDFLGAQSIQMFSLNWIKDVVEILSKPDLMLLKSPNRISWCSKLLFALVAMDVNP